jgi:uncharacterized protein YyaL (SSP411 family)
MANRLQHERSPYLLQHAGNPVDWYPWGPEAFERARTEHKPIFLSVGYSTCHWCHVMEHESFEDASIAEQLNRDFVSIKVDREERPDIDRVHMTFVQATTGAGGWPMTVFLTPDLHPFFGGTYFPPTSRWGRPGFTDVLAHIARTWRDDPEKVRESAAGLLTQLRDTVASTATAELMPVPGVEAVTAGVAQFTQAYDRRNGGFGGAPKFPRPSELTFLLDAWALTQNHEARQMAVDTLRTMALGGMHDHLGGGFHRYSVDAEWRVPHFEKMLFDQSQLVQAYLAAAQASGDPFYASMAEDTLDYVRHDMTAPDGAFYSAEDADSLVPGGGPLKREGAFYVFSAAEVDELFGDDAPIVRRRLGIEDAGNAPSDPHGEFRGLNIPYVAQSVDEIAARTGRSTDDVMRVLGELRLRLYDARNEPAAGCTRRRRRDAGGPPYRSRDGAPRRKTPGAPPPRCWQTQSFRTTARRGGGHRTGGRPAGGSHRPRRTDPGDRAEHQQCRREKSGNRAAPDGKRPIRSRPPGRSRRGDRIGFLPARRDLPRAGTPGPCRARPRRRPAPAT